MSQIWKYPIEPQPGPPGADYAVAEISMPFSNTILHLDLQAVGNDLKPMLWVRVEPGHAAKKYGFYIVPTGADLPRESFLGHYVGTWQLDGLVWHLFRSRT